MQTDTEWLTGCWEDPDMCSNKLSMNENHLDIQ